MVVVHRGCVGLEDSCLLDMLSSLDRSSSRCLCTDGIGVCSLASHSSVMHRSHSSSFECTSIPLSRSQLKGANGCKWQAGEVISVDEVVAFVAERVSPFKKLRGGVVITDSIPKTGSGKILRRLVIQKDRARTK